MKAESAEPAKGGAGGEPATCTDTQGDDANCGACGYACVHGRHCSAGICSPAWQALATTDAPAARTRHAAGFLDGHFVVFGGSATTLGVGTNLSATYDITTDKWWISLAPLNTARCSQAAASSPTAIWTFGGLTDCGSGFTTGPGLERYTTKDGWVVAGDAMTAGARYEFAATWTGSSLFIYGGSAGPPALNTGAIYSPKNNTWQLTSCGLPGCERGGPFSAFVDGNNMRIWGGAAYGNAPAGLSFDLTLKSWSSWQIPAGTEQHVVKRFADDGRRIYFLTATNVVSIYDRKTSSWLANDTAKMPAGFCTEAASAWSGSELIAWSGDCGSGAVQVGGRYQPPAPK